MTNIGAPQCRHRKVGRTELLAVLSTPELAGTTGPRLMQELARGGDVGLAVGVGEQPVVADAVKAGGQHMQQEAAHELVGYQRHRFVAGTTVGSVVLPVKSHAAIITRDEPAVRDRHPMGVARQIGERRFGSGEWALGVDHSLALAKRREPIGEDVGVGQIDVLAEELELPAPMGVPQLFEEAAPKQPRSTRTERKNPGLHGTQRSASGARPPPGTMPCTCG